MLRGVNSHSKKGGPLLCGLHPLPYDDFCLLLLTFACSLAKITLQLLINTSMNTF